jgi:CO/xanthine dehydrogenase Mo-binding subunit
MHFEHGAARDGTLVYVRAHLRFDGGAYTSSSPAVVANAASFASGPYRVPNAHVDADMLFTNNPPCGAMRGFGAVQVAFAHEAQMDRLARELGMDPVDLRVKNALATGDVLIIGQRVDGPAPVAEMLERLRAMPLPQNVPTFPPEAYSLPGGIANVTRGEGVRRGIGYAVAMKNIAFSEGFDDYSTARVRLSSHGGAPRVEVHTAAAECGQGLLMVQEQIARTELGIADVVVLGADTAVGSAGSTSASRQTWMTGSAVKVTCEAVRERLFERARAQLGTDSELHIEAGSVVSARGERASITDLVAIPIEETREYRHRETGRLDPETGQGDIHVAFAFAAHRVVAEVDIELGLVRIVEVATVQDVGKAINPLALEGQIQGGIAQGLGLALMEEIQVKDGLVQNASFTDYLLPTIADMPPIRMDIMELAQPDGPYGANGVGEPPAIASTAAIVAALRDATGAPLTRIPVRPEHLTGIG